MIKSELLGFKRLSIVFFNQQGEKITYCCNCGQTLLTGTTTVLTKHQQKIDDENMIKYPKSYNIVEQSKSKSKGKAWKC